MKNKILWGFTLLPTVITLIATQFMANKVPMHYDMYGNVDRYGSKYENYIFPAIIILMTLFLGLFMRYFKKQQLAATDEKIRKEAQSNEKVICYTAFGMIILFTVMHCSMMANAIIASKGSMDKMAIDINVVVNIVAAIFMAIIGNRLPKTKLNSIVGVRTVWSMKDDKTWAKSNRFGGIVLIISALLIIIETALIGGIGSTFIMVGIIITAGIVCAIYSYRAAK